MNWIHVLHMLTYGYRHVHGTHTLFRWYLNHHAIGFLRSGITSENWHHGLLWWLTVNHRAPVDW